LSSQLIDLLVKDTLAFLAPLLDFADEPDRLSRLFAQVGGPSDLTSDATILTTIQNLTSARDEIVNVAAQPIASISEVRRLLQATRAASEALQGLGVLRGLGFASFGTDLAEHLATTWLRLQHPTLFGVADVLGLVEVGFDAEVVPLVATPSLDQILRYPFRRQRLRPDLVAPLVEDVVGALRMRYAPAGLLTNDSADAMAAKLFPRLDALARRIGATWAYGVAEEHQALLGDAAPLVSCAGALYLPHALTLGADAGIVFTVSSAERGDLGLVAMPFGSLNIAGAIGRWSVELSTSAGVEGVAFGRHGVTLLAAEGVQSASAQVEALLADDPNDGLAFLLGAPTTTRLEVGALGLSANLWVDGVDYEFGVTASTTSCALVIAPSDGDSFLASLFPSSGARVAFDLALGWSTRRGFTLNGSGGGELLVARTVDLGTFAFENIRVVLAVDDDELSFEASAALRAELGPVEVAVDGFGLRGTVAMPSAGGSWGGAEFDLDVRVPNTLGLTVRTSMVRGRGVLTADRETGRYAGGLALDVGGQSLNALGVLNTRLPSGGYSLAAAISATVASVPLGLGFSLEGVGGLIGVRRHVDIDALRSAVRGSGMIDVFFASDPVAQTARLTADLERYFPAAGGRYVFGPAAKIGWGTPKIVEGTIALLLEVPSPVRLALLGKISTALPSRTNPIIELNVDVVGDVDFARKTVAIDATLHDSKVVGFEITGDMALRMGWGDPPSFVLSVGGFHSQFRVPPGFPALRPIKIPIGSGDNPRLDITGFLALTSNTAQVGAQIDLYAAAGPLNIAGNVGFEALLQFLPFAFQADLWGGVALRRGTNILGSVHVDGTLRGPTPWRVSGEACLSLWLVDLCVGFDATFGQAHDVDLPAREVWPLLKAALEEPRSWSSPLPPDVARAVVTGTSSGDAVPRMDPAAALAVRQKVVPLNRTIERFAHVRPSDADRFDITGARLGTTDLPLPTPIDDWFAPAQFEALSDPERLSRPGFEKMVAGATLVGDVVTTGSQLIAQVEYETFTFPSPTAAPEPYRPDFDQQIAGTATAANANAPLRPPRSPSPLVSLDEESFVIASTEDLTARLDLIAAGPRGAAELALREYVTANPGAAGTLQVVPQFEAVA
jgi:hypothetical protein